MIMNGIIGKSFYWGLLVLCCLFGACTDAPEPRVPVIYIDFDKVRTIDLSEQPAVSLEFSERSVIGLVDELRIWNGTYFIRSGENLLRFDSSGRFLNKIGAKGGGSGEWQHFNSFYIKNDSVYIYDAMSKKVLSYDFSGRYVASLSLKNRYKNIIPNYIFPMPDGRFIAKNTFGGDNNPIPSYSILSEDYNVVTHIRGRYLKNGLTTFNCFSNTPDGVLFWELLNDTLFWAADKGTYAPKYYVDFNEKSLPHSIISKDIYDAIAFTNKPENKKRYASLIRSVYEDDDYVTFVFVYDDNIYYAKYNKRHQETQIYKFYYKNRKVEALVAAYQGMLFIPIRYSEEDKNPILVRWDERKIP